MGNSDHGTTHTYTATRFGNARSVFALGTDDGRLTPSLVCEIVFCTDVETGCEPRHSVSGLSHLIQV